MLDYGFVQLGKPSMQPARGRDYMPMTRPKPTFKAQSKPLVPLLWGLWLLFCLRVAGQALVAAGIGGFLPPMQVWYSGLIPYPLLLQLQLVLIWLLGKICKNFTHGQGWLVEPDRQLGRGLLVFGIIYGLVMIARYVICMALMPEQRWLGGTIPIFFHLILASFACLLGRYHYSEATGHRHSDPCPPATI